ncbi:TPA: hypothetical protein N0F65_007649 [Lagenidium giganteum]|uniref:Myb-like domain-containing protein n=1 Tax=Lagenidium giganteum TaxID=4803 RepID=A0AAV2Z9P3_9STRA|nr:TPA: hypothetical protein N0F65_007649 [Lagenidium giganteum]
MGKKLSPILPAYARGKAAAAVAAAATEDKADREEAWTAEEHERFLHALERYGGARCANVHIVWQAMATAVRTRSTIEVKLHAWRYFTFLQETNAEQNTAVDVNVNVSGAQRGGAVVEQRHQQPRKGTEEWTAQDDAHFDELLVLYRKANIDQCPWEAIAARLPGKTARQVRDRYSERQAQMRREEANRRAAVAEAQYAETARRTHTTAPTATTNYPTSSAVRVLLSDLEKDMLFGAMDVVHRSHKGSRDSLESVTAVVIALCRRDSGHSSPPLNTPTFTKADAVAALTRLIRERELNPRRIREYLYNQLRLRVLRSTTIDYQAQNDEQKQSSRLRPAAVLE